MINVSLIILCGLVAVAFSRRQSAALRHWVLAAAIACAAASPFLDRVLPAWQVELPAFVTSVAGPVTLPLAPAQAAAPAGPAAAGTRENPARGWFNAGFTTWLSRIWLIGAVLSFAVLLVGVGRLMWLSARARRLRAGPWSVLADAIARDYGIRREVAILESTHPTLLVTWGVLRPRIMLPAGATEWSEARIRVVLSHELAHIRRGDWIPQLLAEALRSAFWFNPLVWIASRRLRLESEQACDDAVLRQGVGGPEYAEHLLDLARAARHHRLRLFPGFPAPAMARPCSLERRVTAMLNDRLNRTPTTRSARITTSVALLAVTVIAGAIGAGAQTFARFSGSVLDPMNAGVPKVTVILTSLQSQAKHEVRSDDSGRFEFVGLAPGDYQLEAKYPGLMSLKATLTVSGQDVEKNLAMQLGTLEETITVSSARGTVQATAARPVQQRAEPRPVEPCTPAPTGGNIRPPMKVKDVRPYYPQAASDAGTGGLVTLDAQIDGDGYIRDVTARPGADAALAAAAIDAVRQWQFTPTLLNCTPVEVKMKVNVTFKQ